MLTLVCYQRHCLISLIASFSRKTLYASKYKHQKSPAKTKAELIRERCRLLSYASPCKVGQQWTCVKHFGQLRLRKCRRPRDDHKRCRCTKKDKGSSWSVKLSREYLVHVSWIKLASNPCGLDSSRGRTAGRYPEGASSNPARVNIFQLTSAVLDYEKFLFMYISEDDSEIKKWLLFSLFYYHFVLISLPVCDSLTHLLLVKNFSVICSKFTKYSRIILYQNRLYLKSRCTGNFPCIC